MNNINPIYSINNLYLPAFKQKEASNSATTNPLKSNISMQGIDALGNYGKVSSTNKTNKLDIPILTPITIPTNADGVEGERVIEESTGEIRIIQKDNSTTKYYSYRKDGSYSYEIRDNNDNLLFRQSKNITQDGTYTEVTKNYHNNNKIRGIRTIYKDGDLEHSNKYVTPSKDSSVNYPYENIGYNAITNTYYIEKCDRNNKILIQYFDNNLKPISENEHNIRTLLANKKYMETTHEIQMKRDINGDGNISVDETLANDYLTIKYPDLGEKAREALIKSAMSDRNISVSDEEYIRWLEGDEHKEILNEFKLREAQEIRSEKFPNN